MRRLCVLLVLVLCVSLKPKVAQAQIEPVHVKAFMLTSTYGVLAGTLTGIATLAFYKDPSNHLRNVALGASLGLYTGIILGMYLVYFNRPDMGGGVSPDGLEIMPPTRGDDPLNLRGSYEPQLQWMPTAALDQDGRLQLGVALNF